MKPSLDSTSDGDTFVCEITPANPAEHPDHAQDGYGRCSYTGCPCQAYMGKGDLCENCGHNYTLHWLTVYSLLDA